MMLKWLRSIHQVGHSGAIHHEHNELSFFIICSKCLPIMPVPAIGDEVCSQRIALHKITQNEQGVLTCTKVVKVMVKEATQW